MHSLDHTRSPGAAMAKTLRYGRQNLAVLAAQTLGLLLCMAVLHAEFPFAVKAAVVIFFCLMMQGIFSMMHEAFHETAHPHSSINDGIGWFASTLFGAPYTLIKINHEGHHVRNRSRAEIMEYVYPDESRWKKTLVYYFAILGGIWLGSFVATLVLPLIPHRLCKQLGERPGANSYMIAFAEMSPRDWNRLRLEAGATVAVWIGAIWFFSWDLGTLAVTYGAFAFSWSSLQWIYHVRTPFHPVEGAYNLRAPAVIRWLFLNFNYNLQHHREPLKPWQELHEAVEPAETQPLWYRYLQIFQPPEPMPADPSSLRKVYF